MSSPDLTRRHLARIASVGLSLALAGCLRPLYGPTASGAPLQDVLASIEIEPVVTRQRPAIDGKGRRHSAGHAPEPGKKGRQGEGSLPVAERLQRRRQAVPDVMRQAVGPLPC